MRTQDLFQFDPTQATRKFLEGSAFAEATVVDLITGLCSQLLFLREEGREILPAFLFSASPQDTIETFGDQNVHGIHFSPAVALSPGLLIKQMAVASGGSWLPCVELGDPMRTMFVVSRADPYNTPLNRAQHNAIGKSILFIEQVRPGLVTLAIYPSGKTLHLVADPALRIDQNGAGPFEHFVGTLAPGSSASPPIKERLKLVLKRAVSESHGVLFVIADASKIETSMRAFKSSVRLQPPIDLTAGEMLDFGLEEVTEAGTAMLQPIVSALARVDGVVVFGSDTKIHAYRAFVDIEQSAGESSGGARTLARSALLQQHSDKFIAMLFRSQDGQPQFFTPKLS